MARSNIRVFLCAGGVTIDMLCSCVSGDVDRHVGAVPYYDRSLSVRRGTVRHDDMDLRRGTGVRGTVERLARRGGSTLDAVFLERLLLHPKTSREYY